MTYSRMLNCTLPSAQLRFTSEFGMGSGGSIALMSPESWEVSRLGHGPIAPTFIGTERSECLAKNTLDVRSAQGHLRLYGQASRLISTG